MNFGNTEAERRLRRVVVGLSGGVDSAVAACLLQQKGYEVIGATAIVWPDSLCCSTEGLRDAKAVCRQLGIPHHIVDVIPEFSRDVVEPFVREYCRGRTPNPCTVCNRLVKFGAFWEKTLEQLNLKDALFATGHYAKIVKKKNRFLIEKGRDSKKDQSYMLYSLTQEQLARTLFPLGGLNKSQVRSLAKKFGLAVHEKAESQDACFVAGDYQKFIAEYPGTELEVGDFITTSGKVLGRHKGLAYYTVGQRRGLNISYSEPLYVLALDPQTNQVLVGTKPELLENKFSVLSPNWLIAEPKRKIVAAIKVRYNSPAVRGVIDPVTNEIILAKKVEAIAPGQAAVFYHGRTVVGGGIIQR